MNLEQWREDLTRMAHAKREEKPPMSHFNGLPDLLMRDRMVGAFLLEVIRLRERVEDLESRISGE